MTARDVLALLERRGARLVAGESGLERPITWASAMRARPPAFESLQGAELALLSLATLRTLHAQDDTLTLARLIQDLAERGVAAIAVAGLLPPPSSTYLSTPRAAPTADHHSPSMMRPAGETAQRSPTAEEITLADGLELPLLSLPMGTSLAETERDVIAHIARQATAESDRESPRAIYDDLMRASVRGEDDRALGQRLAVHINAAVALEDEGDVRWCAIPATFPVGREALVALLRRPSSRASLHSGTDATSEQPRTSHRGPGGVRVMSLAPDLVRVVAPLEVWPRDRGDSQPGAPEDGEHGASMFLSLIVHSTAGSAARRGDAAPDAQSQITEVLEQIAPLFALALARRQDLAGVERRLRAETLDAILVGTYSDETQMRARAAQLGHDLSAPHAALVIELGLEMPGANDTKGKPHRPSPASALPERTAQASAAMAAALTSAVPNIWVRVRDGEVAALVPLAGASAANALAELVARSPDLLERAAAGVRWSAGIGEPAVGPAELRRSHREARDAARLGSLVLGAGHVARAADLGIYRLLLRLRDSGELEGFCQTTLGPLTSDARTGDALLETLEVFFACNGNLSEAARRLHLHRNSLIYRLNRARDLLGHDLEDPELRLSLQLALKARHVLTL
ncbi:MAG TPA: helix-turn-helix domain-containing protein [Ktedonobacterales bacterium]